MKRPLVTLLLTLGLASCGAQPAFASKDAVYKIERIPGSVCGATAIGRNTLLTAAHCIDSGDKALLVNGTLVGIQHMELDGSDHAILVVTMTFKRHAKRVGRPRQGQQVHWYGNPAGWADMYRTGMVSGYLPDGKVIVDANAWFGDSGSGVFNSRGELVGVVSAIAGQQIFKVTQLYPFKFTDEQWEVVR